MNKYLLIVSLVFSTFVFADLEHTPGQGEKPSSQKLSLSRGCFSEFEQLGCGHPADEHEVFIACLDKSLAHLSANCLAFFERLYGRRN